MSAVRELAAVEPDEQWFGKPPIGLPQWSGPTPKGDADVRIEAIDLAVPAARKVFLDAGDRACAQDPNYISPLRMERMRFLDTQRNGSLASLEVQAFLAFQQGKLAGRITAHVDKSYNAYHHENAGWFGFFDAIDSEPVAHALFDAALGWLKARGARQAIGPVNFTLNHQAGMLVENFSRPPTVEMTYNPSYYQRLATSYGFSKAKDLLAYWIDVSQGLDDPKMRRFHETSEKVRKRYGLTIRGARMRDFMQEVQLLFELYNQTWIDNWGFVPVGEQEFKNLAKDLKQIVVEDLVLIVEDRDKRPIASSITLPNVNEVMPKNGRLFPFGWWPLLTQMKSIRTARLFTLGVLPGYRRRGVEAMLCIETALRANKLGYTAGEIGWTLEDNLLINRAIESFGGKLDRRYRLFGLELS